LRAGDSTMRTFTATLVVLGGWAQADAPQGEVLRQRPSLGDVQKVVSRESLNLTTPPPPAGRKEPRQAQERLVLSSLTFPSMFLFDNLSRVALY